MRRNTRRRTNRITYTHTRKEKSRYVITCLFVTLGVRPRPGVRPGLGGVGPLGGPTPRCSGKAFRIRVHKLAFLTLKLNQGFRTKTTLFFQCFCNVECECFLHCDTSSHLVSDSCTACGSATLRYQEIARSARLNSGRLHLNYSRHARFMI